MPYKILSPRLGVPGDEWVPVEGVNVEALLEHGFLIEIGNKSKPATNSGGKVKPKKESTDAH
jgi:hypothetical protein